mmetsp:Transcript_124200/g.215305  ORF Transcript_124200/g.215305 Transcript_124200/m.215305 type:complete len:201 (+) Transcript_124200:1191-1793(+)
MADCSTSEEGQGSGGSHAAEVGRVPAAGCKRWFQFGIYSCKPRDCPQGDSRSPEGELRDEQADPRRIRQHHCAEGKALAAEAGSGAHRQRRHACRGQHRQGRGTGSEVQGKGESFSAGSQGQYRQGGFRYETTHGSGGYCQEAGGGDQCKGRGCNQSCPVISCQEAMHTSLGQESHRSEKTFGELRQVGRRIADHSQSRG